MTTGRLHAKGWAGLGLHDKYEWVACVDCGTPYPVIGGTARCNGYRIALCPWCRPDSQPWTAGRGA